jgi:hypothetical protein
MRTPKENGKQTASPHVVLHAIRPVRRGSTQRQTKRHFRRDWPENAENVASRRKYIRVGTQTRIRMLIFNTPLCRDAKWCKGFGYKGRARVIRLLVRFGYKGRATALFDYSYAHTDCEQLVFGTLKPSVVNWPKVDGFEY